MRSTKGAIQQSMDSTGTETVMKNRISWTSYDRIRKEEALQSPSASPQTPGMSRSIGSDENTPPSRKHGSTSHLSDVNKEAILTEAQLWRVDEPVNWSDIARRYGVTATNGGQSVKDS